MAAAITIETSYAAMDRDLGQSHIDSHINQHNYLLKNEEPIDFLINNDKQGSIVQQAIYAGVNAEQLRSEKDWENYNKSLRKDRRLGTYDEYVHKVCSTASKKIYRDFDKALQNPKLPKSKRSLIATEFNSLASHDDIPIVGSLFYFGNAEEFEQAKKDGCFETLKKADKWAGNLFIKSKEFQCLHPQMFKLERHNDEKGRDHLQGMEACFTTQNREYKTKKGSVKKRIDSYGRTQYQLNGLVKYFGSRNAVNYQLDRLIDLKQQSQSKIDANDGDRVGLERPETSMLMDKFNQDEAIKTSEKLTSQMKSATLKRLRRQNISVLTRVVDFYALSKAKTTAYQKANLPAKYYQTTILYTTNGQHLTSDQYQLKMNAHNQANEVINQAKVKANETKNIANDESNNIIKKAKKTATNLIKNAKAEQQAAEKERDIAKFEQARIDHQNHVAQQRLINLNHEINNLDEQIDQSKADLNKSRDQNQQLIKSNADLKDSIERNRETVNMVNNLKKTAKKENISIAEVISDRTNLMHRISLIGKAYSVMEKTAKLAITFMIGQPFAHQDENEYSTPASQRAYQAGLELTKYDHESINKSNKTKLTKLPILLAKKAGNWLADTYKKEFNQDPYVDSQSTINDVVHQKDKKFDDLEL